MFCGCALCPSPASRQPPLVAGRSANVSTVSKEDLYEERLAAMETVMFCTELLYYEIVTF